MAVSLERRRVGDVHVITCGGRIVGGPEADELQRLIDERLPLEPRVVLNLAEVTFLDSAGIGALVRMLHRTRRAFGDLKLCRVPSRVADILRITKLGGAFDVHAQEEEAIAAFYGETPAADAHELLGGDILCVDDSADVLAYICGVLREAGYRALPCGNTADARVLLKVSRPRVLVIGSRARARFDAGRANAGSSLPILELPDTFAGHDPAESSRDLLARVRVLAGEPV